MTRGRWNDIRDVLRADPERAARIDALTDDVRWEHEALAEDWVVAVVATKDEPELGKFVRLLGHSVDQVIVCDESDDLGPGIDARAAGGYVLECHGGIGPSTVAGWKEALGYGAEKVVQIDAGGSHNPREIPGLLQSDADVVIGSRFVTGSRYYCDTSRAWRKYASRAYATMMNARTGEKVHDWTSGFRVFTRGALEHLAYQNYHATMHGFNAEVLARALEAGMTVEERPVGYVAGRSGLSWGGVREAVRVR